MAKKKPFEFYWNGSASTVIRNLGFGKDLNRDVAKIFLSYADAYTPYDTGLMSKIVGIRAFNDYANITYYSGYADKQYNGPSWWNRNLNHHPLATSYWDKYTWQNHSYEITQEVNSARKKYRTFSY